MEASRAEAISIGIEEELTVPEIVEHNHSAHRLNKRLLREGLLSSRHNGELDRDANPDDWVDPVSAQKIFENWNRSIAAVPLIEHLEATGQLDLAAVRREPEWLKEAEIHQALHALVKSMLGDEPEVGAVHPRSRARYRISAEDVPAKRLAVVIVDPEEVRFEDAEIICRQALVYDRQTDGGRFRSQWIYREITRPSEPVKGEPEGRLDSVQPQEGAAGPVDLVSNLCVLAESSIVTLENPDSDA